MEASGSPTGSIDFQVLPHQLRFGHLIQSRVRHPAIIGGAGLGKTKVIVASSITLCSINTGLPMVVTEPTYGMVIDILEPAIRESCEFELLLDEQGLIVFEGGSPVLVPRKRPIPFQFQARNHAFFFPWWGSTILCRSGEKPRRLRGPNLAAAAIDEAGDQEEEVFTTLQGRVRHPAAQIRCIMVAGTPRGFNWMYQRWAEPGGLKRLKNAALVRAKSTDNVLITSADPEWEISMRNTYDPELYKQEVLGEFVAIGQHSTYYGFDRKGNLRNGFEQDHDLPVTVHCAFNRAPMTWVFSQSPRVTATRFIGELPMQGPGSAKDTHAACDEVIRRFGDPIHTEYQVFGDASGHTPTLKKNYSDYEIIRERLNTAPRVNRRNEKSRDRTNSLNALLTNAAGEHRILIDEEKCPMLVRDLEQVKNIPNTFDIDGSNEELTHYANAISFWAVAEHPIIAGRRNG